MALMSDTDMGAEEELEKIIATIVNGADDDN